MSSGRTRPAKRSGYTNYSQNNSKGSSRHGGSPSLFQLNMASLLSYTLKIQDLFSGPIRKAASAGERALGGISKTLQNVQGKAGAMGNAVATANGRIVSTSSRAVTSLTSLEIKLNTLTKQRALSMNINDIRKANRAIEDTERRMERLQNIGRRGSGSGISIGGVIAGGALLAGLTGSLQTGFEAQAQKTSFEVMAGAEKGGKLFQDLTKFAQDSIFGNELYKNAQTLKAFGVETEKVMPTLKMLGDVSMGNKERLSALSLAFAQVKSAGKLTGQDLLQFVNAGFNPLQIISQQTGLSMAVLRDKMRDGAISAQLVERAFQAATAKGGQFYNMTEKIAGTDFGKWEAFKGQVQGLSMELGGVLAPIAGNVIKNVLVPMAEWVGKNQTVVLALGGAVLTYVAGVKIAALTTTAWTAATALYETVAIAATTATGGWATAMAILDAVMAANPIGLIVGAIAALVAGVIYCWNTFEGFRGFIYGFGFGAMELFRGLGNVIAGAFTINPAQIAEGVQQLMNINKRYQKGFEKGVDSLRGTKTQGISEFLGAKKPDQVTQEGTSSFGAGVGLGDTKGKSGSATGAGRGVTHIIINVGVLGQTTIHTSTVKEGVGQMKENIRAALFEVLNDANAMTTAG